MPSASGASSSVKLWAERRPDGWLVETWLLGLDGGAWAIELRLEGEAGGERLPLPAEALRAVFARYGRPLDVNVSDEATIGVAVARLDDEQPARVRVFRFMRWGDVEPQVYAALERERAEGQGLGAPAPLIAGALAALARAAGAKNG